MKTILSAIVGAALWVTPNIANACFSCANGVNAAEWADRCPASQTLWDEMASCIGASCPDCANWIADPAAPQSDACVTCEYGACYPQIDACSYDTTGCLSCSAWFTSPGAPADVTEDNLCWYAQDAQTGPNGTGPYPVLDLSWCACDPKGGACSQKCGADCIDWGVYVDPATGNPKHAYSLYPWSATPACVDCLRDSKKGCSSSYGVCAAN